MFCPYYVKLLYYADAPSPPLNLRCYYLELSVDFQWEVSLHAEQYFITISPPVDSGSTFTTTNTTIQVPVLHNQEYNISVVANNCAGNSTPSTCTAAPTVNHPAWCSYPITGPNVSVESYSSGLGGSWIIYYCQPGLVPSEQMMANSQVSTVPKRPGQSRIWSPCLLSCTEDAIHTECPGINI